MKICVIGAGAMGCSYGGLLSRAGHAVTLVDIWPEHVAALNTQGLHLDGVVGDLHFPVSAQCEVPVGLNADLAMIWTDTNNTRAAAEAADRVLAADGYAITLQNGIGNVETLVEVLGKARVAAGSSMCSAAMRGPGHASLTHRGMTSIGEIDGGGSARLDGLLEALQQAGFEARIHPTIMSLVWTKFTINCSINALCATSGLRLGELARLPAMDRLQDRIIDEILAVTAAKGITLDEPDLRGKVKAHCWAKFSRPSMLQHMEAGKRTEIHALNARLVEEGRSLGVPTPYNDAVACLLQGVEHKRRDVAGRSEADYQALEEQARNEPRPPRS
ncbi:MAG: ketopantoate reductase family protein [Candidatus Competibacteraceae bacterium]|nr:ketopantoate reductase family protein [Candidatus Competibacteraceae bacterium]